MNCKITYAAFFFLHALLLSPIMSQYINAATTRSETNNLSPTQLRLAKDECRETLGPFATMRRAYEVRDYYRDLGYETSDVWGEGGIYYGTREYYVNVWYPCNEELPPLP